MEKDNKRQNKKTKAKMKMYFYLLSLSDNKDFKDEVLKIRKTFGIPENGFDDELENEFDFINNLPVLTNGNGDSLDFQKEVYDLAGRFDLTVAWLSNIYEYVLYDDVFFSSINSLVDVIDLFDMVETISDYNYKIFDYFRGLIDSYPISISVSPNATSRDIVEYVKDNYTDEIKPLQEKYKYKDTKIGKTRKRDSKIKERNDFICKNKDLSAKEIVKLVSQRYGEVLDYTYINQIISKKCKHK